MGPSGVSQSLCVIHIMVTSAVSALFCNATYRDIYCKTKVVRVATALVNATASMKNAVVAGNTRLQFSDVSSSGRGTSG
jgi:hypothetical protein